MRPCGVLQTSQSEIRQEIKCHNPLLYWRPSHQLLLVRLNGTVVEDRLRENCVENMTHGRKGEGRGSNHSHTLNIQRFTVLR